MENVRDFTDAAKTELEKMIENAQAEQEGWWFFNDIWDWASDPFIDGNIEHYAENIRSYHQQIIDKKNTGKSQLNKIFLDVYAVEADYTAKFEEINLRAANLKKAFANLAEILNPAPADGGDCILARSPKEFTFFMNKSTSIVYNAVMYKVASFDENGSASYNWQEIDRILSKEAGDITEMEYYVLASLYAVMDTEDVEKFIQALADKTEDCTGSFLITDSSSHTKWEYKQTKLDGLQKYLSAHTGMLNFQYQTINDIDPMEFKALFQQAYPGVDFSEAAFQDQKDKILAILDNQRLDILQKNTLLTICGQLGRETDSKVVLFSSFIDFEGLTGEKDAFGPKITLEKDTNGDYLLSFCNFQRIISPARPSIYPDNQSPNNFSYSKSDLYKNDLINKRTESGKSDVDVVIYKNNLIIKRTVTGTNCVDVAIENLEIYFSDKYNFSIGQEVAGKGVEYLTDEIRGEALNFVKNNLTKKVSSKAAKTAIGFIPIVGDLASLGWEIVEDEAENSQNVQQSEAIVKTFQNASYCNRFQLDSNWVVTGDVEKVQIVYYPSPNTQKVLNKLNHFLERENVDLSAFQLELPITISDLYQYADKINSMTTDEDIINMADNRIIFDNN